MKMILNLNLMSVTLLVSGKKGLAVIEAIADTEFGLMLNQVVIAKDSNVICDYSEEIIAICNSRNLQYRLSGDRDIEYTLGKIIAIGWQKLLPYAENNVIVLHDSLLPAYRGFSPLVSQLLCNEPFLGVTAIIANNIPDGGNIVYQEAVAVNYPISIQSAIDLLLPAYINATLFILSAFRDAKELDGLPQNESDVTFSLWRDEEDYRINWNDSAHYIHQFVLAHGYPFKGASTMYRDKLIRISETKELSEMQIVNRTPGKVISLEDGFPVVVCGAGLLKITGANFDTKGQSLFPLKFLRTRFI